MARKPELSDDDLYEVATYLGRTDVETEIHAEMPQRARTDFEERYSELTESYPLPASVKTGPFYIWPENTNKYGMELRIYFRDSPPTPPVMRQLFTDQGKWFARREKYRINHTNLVFQLLECGFLLGDNSENTERIEEFMRRRFPSIAESSQYD